MKLKFDDNLEYQLQAIASVVDLFSGQTPMHTNFTVSAYSGQIGLFDTANGVGNRLELDKEEILSNLQNIQLRNRLPQTATLKAGMYDFDIEMETGTGKTYVYIRTILELHKNYGFSKFIIVVPSVAIKEGVYKSLQVTKEHFQELYDNTIYNFFVYDSSNLEQVRSFAVSSNIEIMVINIDAFRKSFKDPTKENKANIIHRAHDRLSGMRPIELIQETRPFVIIDEPQSVDTTPKAKEAIRSLNPLCTLRYSATHVEKHNLVYKLDAVDSYNLELVKQIEVAGFETKDYHNKAYIKLISVNNKKSPITAKMELDIKNRRGEVKRDTVTVKQGDDLYEKSNGRDVYDGYIVNDIYCEKGNEYVDFTSKPDILFIGKPIGDVDDLVVKEQQIRKTIEEHLNKELVLNKQGIKVLSLFFIDRVANYRYYDENGTPHKGIYAELFEKHYKDLIRRPKYNKLFKDIDWDTAVEGVHNGYFSVDKAGVLKDTSGHTQADENIYNLIMKDKERLLSFDTKLRFIFSHSALREGWDNPNVFQICTLNETKSEVKKRQEIGRGMRIAVNQDGERQHGFAINTLTVMANESYEEFASALQKEYEEDTGIRFGIVEKHLFANIPAKQDDGSIDYLGQEASEVIYRQLVDNGYIDNTGRVQDKLKIDIRNNDIQISGEFESIKTDIITIVSKVAGSLNIKNNSDKKQVRLNKQVYLDPEFKELWDKIKYKTTYSVEFDSKKLIEVCCEAIKNNISVSSAKLIYTKAELAISAAGVTSEESSRYAVALHNLQENLPDIIAYLQNETYLTRKTIVEILIKSDTLHLFKKNPQRYMEQVVQIITAKMRLMIVDGIKYTKIGDEEYYAQELFETEELTGYLSKNMIESKKSVYEYVIYDSANEEDFAINFENNNSIKLYAKLPRWFTIATPLGSYNPDWVVLIEVDGKDKLYFVVETKANIQAESIRPVERAKIKCGKKHFEALGNEVIFKDIDNYKDFIEEYVVV
ncbi:MAG TPA: DEAD/DEAH box helicase family protein [Clostridia bacterium]|jgi:type III restriction enzyme|nr:DEAD/DEAH box helicase family protein [Clostridiaceae bacterium]HOF26679.1 DEAD/DEAH box helicase family protein [Clostridia bacterium]HOM34144.1 DEAD/DEAH box helicase family protein [Clostridia bacterium]HOR89809.1 DEAD/DEAH box helicase family protein [Clostridia bacterium]HPL08159.1 DEAD/DEAH box helicase family protein [Clostridia bacterium]